MVAKRLLPLLALVAAACASTNAPMRLHPPPAAAPPPASDLKDFRKDLEATYGQLVARDAKPLDGVTVDLEAAASLPIPERPSVRSAVSLFSGSLKDNIQTYLTRSAKYKQMIDGALATEGLPKALAYLPVIESGYSSTLTSRAGARGIWQFMSDTAREYGLRVDWWVDERADPERSTRAAARYLKDLHREFDDWALTLAAYNAGPGRVRRALADTGASSFWELSERAALPKETRGYVPTFFATILIASDPATYGFRLSSPDATEIRRLELEGPLSLKYLAQVANLDEDTVRDLNPAFRRGVLPPGKSSVRLPAQAAALVASRSANLKNEDAEISVCSFILREGDSLKHIARSIGTTVDTLVAMNGLGSASRLGEGDSLYLPVRARELGAMLQQQDIYYAVRKGDTFYSIAKTHNLTVEELRDLNDLSRHARLHPGQSLLVTAPRSLSASGM
jgi:membrane-bound lytic murein transglycosylase D